MAKKISIVIPTIEEPTVFELIDEIRSKLGKNTEIIIVDKSSDEYYNKVKAAGVKVIRQTDKGVESAIMQGLRAAHGDLLASTDADGTHVFEGIIDGIKLVEAGKADFVLGNRFGKLKKGAMSKHIYFGNAALSKIYSIMYKVKVKDILTGLFVMSRKAFDSIRNKDTYRAGIAFFAIEVAKKGYKIAEVPISYYPRREGTESKLAGVNPKLGSKVFWGVNTASHMIRMARDYNPLLIFGGLGVILILIGIVIGLNVVFSYLATGVFNFIGRSLIAFMLVVVGVLAIIGGFILDLLLEIDKKLEKKM